MNTIDNNNAAIAVNSVLSSTTDSTSSTTTSTSSISSSLLTDGRVDISKLLLEVQKLLREMVTTLQDYLQKQLAQSYDIQKAVFESQNKAIDEKKAGATAALIGGAISSVLGILGSFAAINSATKGASDVAQQAASTSAKSIGTVSEASTKALAKASEGIADAADDAAGAMQQTIATAAKAASRTSGITDDVATSAQKASQVAEEAADAAQELAQKAGLLSRFTAAAGRISGSTPFIVVTSLAEGTKTLPTTISESVKSNHDINEQRAKSVENLQASNLDTYKQDVRRAQDDISSRLRDMTTTARDLTDLINRMGQAARLAGELIMVDTFNDEVFNYYLEQKGYTIQKEFLCGSAFFIGWRIETPFFSLAYRLDEQELILCSFEARNQTGLNGPVLSLTRLLEELYHHFSGIKKISAMKSKIGSDSERQKREELFNYFIRKGAVQQETEDGIWFVMNVNS
ncbi:type III secretion system regulator family protein [Escherichia coli 3-073-06_S1_C1]|nr:type III secretion system regulator family protein [Escherichia coli 3-073-06_S1_C1]